jgi:hypothetical protein
VCQNPVVTECSQATVYKHTTLSEQWQPDRCPTCSAPAPTYLNCQSELNVYFSTAKPQHINTKAQAKFVTA